MQYLDKITALGNLVIVQADQALSGLKLYMSSMDNLHLFFLLLFPAALLLLLVALQIRLARAHRRIDAVQHELAEAHRDLEREKIWRKAAGDDQTVSVSEDA